jgi:hypothetical protein
MHKKQLQDIRHHVAAALLELNWQGKFTQEIREATVETRLATAKHLEHSLKALDVELRRCDLAIDRRRNKAEKKAVKRAERLPYADN